MKLKDIMLGKINQSQKGKKLCDSTRINYIVKTIQTEIGKVVTKSRGQREQNQCLIVLDI